MITRSIKPRLDWIERSSAVARGRATVCRWNLETSFEVIENGIFRKLGYGFLFAFHSNHAVWTQYTNVTDTQPSSHTPYNSKSRCKVASPGCNGVVKTVATIASVSVATAPQLSEFVPFLRSTTSESLYACILWNNSRLSSRRSSSCKSRLRPVAPQILFTAYSR